MSLGVCHYAKSLGVQSRSTDFVVTTAACAAVSWWLHFARDLASAPGPVELYSAYVTFGQQVFSLGQPLIEEPHPQGAMWLSIQQSLKTTCALLPQARPSSVRSVAAG
eukprot:COSAG01_NODE_343_length_18564_cov_10.381099_14_plen_108_part_00